MDREYAVECFKPILGLSELFRMFYTDIFERSIFLRCTNSYGFRWSIKEVVFVHE